MTAQESNREVVALLLDRGADPNLTERRVNNLMDRHTNNRIDCACITLSIIIFQSCLHTVTGAYVFITIIFLFCFCSMGKLLSTGQQSKVTAIFWLYYWNGGRTLTSQTRYRTVVELGNVCET